MTSINAQNVAKEVLETIGKDKKVKLGQIALKNGYAQNTADNPKLITETESYKKVINPVVERMIRERDRLIEALSTKDLDKVSYRDGVDAVDKLTKNVQLLTGGSTENVAVQGVEITVRK